MNIKETTTGLMMDQDGFHFEAPSLLKKNNYDLFGEIEEISFEKIEQIFELKKKENRSKHILEYLQQYYDEIEPMDFYRFIFPEGALEKKGEYIEGKYTGILREVTSQKYIDSKGKERNRVNRYNITDDLEILKEVIQRNNNEFVITQPISYIGKSATAKNARELYALVIDLDGIKVKEVGDNAHGMHNLFYQFTESKQLPMPTFVVMSGTGIHLYYVFEKPIKLYYHVVNQLTKLKNELTKRIWYGSVTRFDKNIQYEPIVQPFRAVGTATKMGTKARAFICSNERVTIDYLNEFVPNSAKAILDEKIIKNGVCLEEAKKMYPEWYETVVKKGQKKGWQFNRAVYDKWMERLRDDYDHFHFGNRYWSIFILAATAWKCGISFEEVEEDAYSLVDKMNQLSKEEPFYEEDVAAALRGYDPRYVTLSTDFINRHCDNILPSNKRNNRSRYDHLQSDIWYNEKTDPKTGEKTIKQGINMCKQQREFALTKMRENGEIKGRPKGSGEKKAIVVKWKEENPKGKKAQCHRETGLSRTTIDKWWGSDENL